MTSFEGFCWTRDAMQIPAVVSCGCGLLLASYVHFWSCVGTAPVVSSRCQTPEGLKPFVRAPPGILIVTWNGCAIVPVQNGLVVWNLGASGIVTLVWYCRHVVHPGVPSRF